MNRTTVILFCYLFLSACDSTDRPAVSFYYWRTVFALSPEEKKVLEQNQVSRLYIRYFDVVLNQEEPVPLSTITFNDAPGLDVIPVVYIKNEVMLAKALQVNDLAEKVMRLIDQINKQNSIASSEIQIDCDWTLSSKDTYFRFIESLKKLTTQKLSATIRLHQVKYFQRTGVPPVDSGVLMYYNMGHLEADSSNSIYERTAAVQYTAGLKRYPLPLDVALPIFSWGVHIRNHKVIALLNKVDEHTFLNDTSFAAGASSFFEVKSSVIRQEKYFEKGDLVKIESIGTTDLQHMAEDLSDKLNHKPSQVIFYDLDTFNLKHYRHEEDLYQDISSTF